MSYGIGAVIAGLLFFCLFQGTRDRDHDHEPKYSKIYEPKSRTYTDGLATPLRDLNVSWDSVQQRKTTSLNPGLPTIASFTPLPKKVVNGVEKFVFFIGYPRSGHSIIGSMMDAHPDIVIAHEFMLFRKWPDDRHNLTNKSYLFNALYEDSYRDAMKGWRSSEKDKKGYTLGMASSWQGRFRQLRVIGDKSGGQTAIVYSLSPKRTCKIYKELMDTVKVPIHIIHVIRNPYDMIATGMLYKSSDVPGEKRNATTDHPYRNIELLMKKIRLFYSFASAVQGMIQNCHLENVLDIHHADHVKDPKATLQRICNFLEVKCPEDYLQECDDKTYQQLSKTRDLVMWNQKARTMAKTVIKKFPFFHRYSFDRDY